MGLSREQFRTVVILLIGAVLVVLNQTLLSPAFPTIMADLQVDATTVQWLTSGYSLVEAVVIPLSAYFMGKFQPRKLFMGGLAIFAAGSLLAACAPLFFVLLLGRMLQASATGFIMPLVFSSILMIFPREKRGSAMGIVALVIGFAPAIGPSLSGVLVQFIGWRALFITVTLLSIIVDIMAALRLRYDAHFEPTTFDKLSVVLSSTGLLALLYGLSSITSTDEPLVQVALIVVGSILLTFFVRRQFKLPVPFLRVQVLKARNFAASVSTVSLFMAALVGAGVLMPIFIQNILGATPLETGLIMLPGAVIGAVTAMVAGRMFDKFGARRLVLPGTFIAFLGACGLMLLNTHTPLWFITCIYTLLAMGLEFTMTPLNTWGINSLDNKLVPHASATANTINQISASLGTAILVSLASLSALIFPTMPQPEQTMAGMHIAFIFTTVMLGIIFVGVCILVRDKAQTHEQVADADERLNILNGPAAIQAIVSDVMNTHPYAVHTDDTIREVANLLATHKTSGVPVVDADDNLVGFISDGDIMKYIGRSDATVLDPTMMLYRVSDNEDFIKRLATLLNLNVQKIATKRVISVDANMPLEDACRLFAEKHLKKVPVVENGKLVGSLSRSDIIRSTMENLAGIEALAEVEE